MYQQVILIGRLGTDVEVKDFENGKFASFSLATTKHFNNVEKTTWHQIKAFGKLADVCKSYISKGSKVFIEGEISTSSYVDKEGNKRMSFEIIASKIQFLDNKDKDTVLA